jgi:hypothetical protein
MLAMLWEGRNDNVVGFTTYLNLWQWALGQGEMPCESSFLRTLPHLDSISYNQLIFNLLYSTLLSRLCFRGIFIGSEQANSNAMLGCCQNPPFQIPGSLPRNHGISSESSEGYQKGLGRMTQITSVRGKQIQQLMKGINFFNLGKLK